MGQATPASIFTILFTDIVASTALYGRLGDEGAEELRRKHFRLLRDAVAARGGQEVKNVGDGLMVVFGSARDAVACAVAVQQGVERQNARDPDRALGLRIGLHVGEPVQDEGDFWGLPVVVTRRLCDQADSGQILASEVVKALVGSRGGVTFRDLGPLTLRGVDEEIEGYEVMWERALAAPVRFPTVLSSGEPASMVGRIDERELMQVAFKKALTDRLQVVLVSGEAGIGKTRLCSEFARRAHAEDAIVLAGRCDAEPRGAFHPIVEALEAYVRDASAEVVRNTMGRHAAVLGSLIPALGERVAIEPVLPLREPEADRYRLFEAVASFLGQIAYDRPVVLVLDDLQWADEATVLLLRSLIRDPNLRSCLVLGTIRDEELDPGHPLVALLAELRREEERVTRLHLRGLGVDDVGSLLLHAMDGDQAAALAPAIHEITEGNPFFVREVAGHLTAAGTPAPGLNGGDRVLARPVDDLFAELGLPEGVREVVGLRLARLGDATLRTLRIASVIGREFDLDLVVAVTESDEDDVLEAMEDALAAQVIVEVAGLTDRFAFAHALVYETLREDLTASRRVRLHRKVGEAIERLRSDELGPYLAELAYHFAESVSSEAARAVHYSRLAAEQAVTQRAYEEAIAHYERALAMVGVTDPDDGRARCELLLGLSVAQRPISKEPAQRTARSALEQSRELGDPELVARAALLVAETHGRPGFADADTLRILEEGETGLRGIDHPLRAWLLGRMAIELADVDPDRHRELVAEALAIADRLKDPGAHAYALWASLWLVPTERAEFDAFLETVPALRQSAIEAGIDWLGATATWQTLVFAVAHGQTDDAWAAYEMYIAEGEERSPNSTAWTELVWSGMHALLQGRLAAADDAMHKALAAGTAIEDPLAVPMYFAQLFVLRLLQGRIGEMEPTLTGIRDSDPDIPWTAVHALLLAETGRDIEARELLRAVSAQRFKEIKRNSYWFLAVALYADVCFRVGDVECAEVLYEMITPWEGLAPQVGLPCTVYEPASTHLARLAVLLDRREVEEGHLADALAMCERMRARTWRARMRADLAFGLLRRNGTGDRARAFELATEALPEAEEIGMVSVVERCRAVLQSGG